MFGYVKTVRGELRVREYEYYRASYCGLCRSMGKCTGQCSRLLLNYDLAYLATVRMALLGTTPTFRRRRCIAHPFRRRMMMEPGEQLRYCAEATVILAYEKCRDDLSDERGWGRAKARLRRLALAPMYRRAKKRAPELAAAVRERLAQLSAAEAAGTSSVDAVAAIFGDLLADVCAFGLPPESERLARKIGWETGRFIYILDAVEDLADDAKKKRFNPLLPRYGAALDDTAKETLNDALIACLYDLDTAIDLLPPAEDPTRQEILKNILYLGLPKALRRVLYGERDKEEAREQQPL